MPPETSPVPAQLLERLLIDSDFRVKFRKDPVAACRAFGLDDLADQMTGQGKSMQTLEIRESKSSLAGVLLAAAAEAVGVVELVRYASGDGPLGGEAQSAVRQALSSPRLQAISMSQIRAVEAPVSPIAPEDQVGAPAAAPDPAPARPSDGAALREDLAAAANCPDCGSPTVAMGEDVTVCSNCGLRQDGVKMDQLSADDQAALREDLMAAGNCSDCAQPLPVMADGSNGSCVFCGALSAGAAHVYEGQDLAPAPSLDAARLADASAPGAFARVGADAPVGDAPQGPALGEQANEVPDPGESAKQTLGKPGDERIAASGRMPAGDDAPLSAGADLRPGDDIGPDPGGGRAGAALPRDEPPMRVGQAAAPQATVRVAAVRVAPGTEGDPPQSVGADTRGSDGGDRIEGLASDVTPAPSAPAGVPVAPVAPEFTAGSNDNGALHGSEFDYQDAEGAPFSDGTRRHAGYDLFADANAPVRSPVSGTIVEVRASRGNSGQVFGGTVKIQGADGRVWVFRHIDPGSVTEGQQIQAGQQVASVTDWTGGQSHIHVERWLTYEGGYNGDNMIDPLPELTAAYTGQPAPGIPPGGLQPGDTPGAPGAVEAAVAADPQVLYKNAVQALLDNPKITLPEGARADLAAGVVDPRLVIMLTKLSEKHTISLSVIKTGHSQFVAGTQTPSNHFAGRGIDIATVDGEIVNPGSAASRVLAEELGQLGPPLTPDEIGSPFSIGTPPYFTDGDHQDHIHVGFDTSLPPDTPLPYPDSVQAASAAAPIEASMGRQSGVFAAVRAAEADKPQTAGTANRGMTVQFMQAVTAPDPTAAPQAQPIAATPTDVPPGTIISADQFDPGDITPHPGPTASREAVAQWMAVNAQKVGLPPELPIMAGITESGLRYGLTPDVSDADSGGYFQMRVSIWNIPPWENYMNEPEKQLHWFLSQALALKDKRIGDGIANFGQDPGAYGEWCADVERPAAQYRYRYQEHFEEARQLIAAAPSPAPAST